MTVASYDKINKDLRLGLPFREGAGAVSHDESPYGRILPMTDPGGGSFAWGNLATGIPYLQFVAVGGGATDGVYLDCPAADTGDLNFTTGDYSIGGWINWDGTGGWSEYIIGRGGVDLDGWDIYLALSGGRNTLNQRHHHAGVGTDRSECYSEGFTPGEWHFFGSTRIGLVVTHFRNGRELVMDTVAGGMLDPTTCNRDVVVGSRYTKDANWYRNMMWNIRVWSRALSPEEWLFITHREGHWFGVN